MLTENFCPHFSYHENRNEIHGDFDEHQPSGGHRGDVDRILVAQVHFGVEVPCNRTTDSVVADLCNLGFLWHLVMSISIAQTYRGSTRCQGGLRRCSADAASCRTRRWSRLRRLRLATRRPNSAKVGAFQQCPKDKLSNQKPHKLGRQLHVPER